MFKMLKILLKKQYVQKVENLFSSLLYSAPRSEAGYRDTTKEIDKHIVQQPKVFIYVIIQKIRLTSKEIYTRGLFVCNRNRNHRYKNRYAWKLYNLYVCVNDSPRNICVMIKHVNLNCKHRLQLCSPNHPLYTQFTDLHAQYLIGSNIIWMSLKCPWFVSLELFKIKRFTSLTGIPLYCALPTF